MVEDDISISHRLPASISPRYDENGVELPPPPSLPTPIIIAKFVRRYVRDEFYRARLKLKGKSTRDLEGFATAQDNHIYKKLFKSCLKVKKELKFKFISTTNGRIYLRKDLNSRSAYTGSESDLTKLKARVTQQAPHAKADEG